MPQCHFRAEGSPEAGRHLGREGNLRHQHQHRTAACQHFPGGLEIHFGLAAAGHPLKQERGEPTPLTCLVDLAQESLLLSR